MARPVPHSTTISGKKITVWGDPTNVSAFFGLTPDADAGPVNIQADFPPTTRRRYPGDPAPISVKAHTKTYSRQAAAKQTTTPGRAFQVEEHTGTPPNVQVQTWQFTLVGSFARLRTLADGSFAPGQFLRSPNGKLYKPVAAP